MIEYTNEDCMTGMARYPDKYFDLAIVDPPYGIGESGGRDRSRNVNRTDPRSGKPIIVKHKGYKRKEWDSNPPADNYFEELFRVSKNQIIWGGNFFDLPPTSCVVVWDKCNGESDFADCELAWTNQKTAVRLFRFMWSGFCQGKGIKSGHINQGNKSLCEIRIHPTQKPVALYKWLLKNYAKPNDKILDTHVGSASSLIACYDMGFDAVGFELDPDYYAASKRRLEDFMRQPKLTELMTEEPEQMALQLRIEAER